MSPALTALLAASFGLVAGAVFGGAQWLALRRHAQKAGWWLIGNALGWAAALVWTYLAASLIPPGLPLAVVVTTGGAAGLLAGLPVGVITGFFLLRLQDAPAQRQSNFPS